MNVRIRKTAASDVGPLQVPFTGHVLFEEQDPVGIGHVFKRLDDSVDPLLQLFWGWNNSSEREKNE